MSTVISKQTCAVVYDCPVCFEERQLQDDVICEQCVNITCQKCVKDGNMLSCPMCRSEFDVDSGLKKFVIDQLPQQDIGLYNVLDAMMDVINRDVENHELWTVFPEEMNDYLSEMQDYYEELLEIWHEQSWTLEDAVNFIIERRPQRFTTIQELSEIMSQIDETNWEDEDLDE